MILLLDRKRIKMRKLLLRNLSENTKKLAKKKLPLPFNISDIADAETVDYNNGTNINDVLSNKSAQTAAKRIVKKYRNLARKKPYQ